MPYNQNYNGYRATNQMSGAAPQNSYPRGAAQVEPKTTSNGPTLYNNSAMKYLSMNYWGKFSSIEIGVIPAGVENGGTFRSTQKTQQIIGFSDLNDLQDVCEEVIESLKNTGTFTSTAISVGTKGTAIVEVNNGTTLGLNPGIYLVLYKNVDANGRSNLFEYYPFSNTRVLREYDHNSGTYKEDVAKIGEFKKFYRAVKEAVKAFTMAQAHAIAEYNRNDRIAQFKTMSAIARNLGVDIPRELDKITSSMNTQQPTGRSYQRPKTGYGAPRSTTFESGAPANTPRTYNAPVVASMNDPVDISIPMATLNDVDMSKFR